MPGGGKDLLASAVPKPDSTPAHRQTGAGLAVVTVPADTFSCYPVESQSERASTPRTGPRTKSGGRQVDYYDPAVGLVKTNYYDKNGKLLQSRVLSRR